MGSRSRNHLVRNIPAAAAIAVTLMLSGCGGTSDTANAELQQPQVDPRFATIEAMLDYYNSLATRDPVDVAALLDTCYAENELQRRFLALTRSSVQLMNLDRAMFDKFGEGWEPGEKKPMSSPDQPAKLVSTDGQRAQAEFLDSRGKKEIVQFVKIGDRWWVSGYTFEYDPESKPFIKEIDAMDRLFPAIASAAASMHSRVVAGEFRSANDVRMAVMIEVMRNNPALQADLQKLAAAAK